MKPRDSNLFRLDDGRDLEGDAGVGFSGADRSMEYGVEVGVERIRRESLDVYMYMVFEAAYCGQVVSGRQFKQSSHRQHVHANYGPTHPLGSSNTLHNSSPNSPRTPPVRPRRRPPVLPHLRLSLPPPPARSTRSLPMGQHVPDPQIPTLGSNGEMDGRVRTDLHNLDGTDEPCFGGGECGGGERVVGQARWYLEFETEDDYDE